MLAAGAFQMQIVAVAVDVSAATSASTSCMSATTPAGSSPRWRPERKAPSRTEAMPAARAPVPSASAMPSHVPSGFSA